MLTILGTVKIDDAERLAHFENNLASLGPIADRLGWTLNVAGRHSARVGAAVTDRWPGALITEDGVSDAYSIMRGQLEALPDAALCFYWLEDHWYVCQDTPAFLCLLDRFANGRAEVLTISHLTCSWQQKAALPVVDREDRYTVYRADPAGYQDVWRQQPGSYAAGIPMICKKEFATAMLDACRVDLEHSKKPGGFELPPHKAGPFLEAHPFLEMVPSFHVCREVFRQTGNPRAILWDEAVKLIGGRDA